MSAAIGYAALLFLAACGGSSFQAVESSDSGVAVDPDSGTASAPAPDSSVALVDTGALPVADSGAPDTNILVDSGIDSPGDVADATPEASAPLYASDSPACSSCMESNCRAELTTCMSGACGPALLCARPCATDLQSCFPACISMYPGSGTAGITLQGCQKMNCNGICVAPGDQ